MRKLKKILSIAICSVFAFVFFTSCKNTSSDSSSEVTSTNEKTQITTEQNTTLPISSDNSLTKTTEESVVDIPPYYWVCNEIIHYATGETKNTVLYSGTLDDFNDDAILDGYELKGVLYPAKKLNGLDKNELETFGFEGNIIIYNEEKDSYILWKQMKSELSIAEHICSRNCKNVEK